MSDAAPQICSNCQHPNQLAGKISWTCAKCGTLFRLTNGDLVEGYQEYIEKCEPYER